MNIITFFADFSNLKTRANQTFDVTFNVNELAPEQAATLISYLHKSVAVAVKDSPITDEEIADIPEPQKEFPSDKTPSQRARAVLYVLWKQTKKKMGDTWQMDADTHYKHRIDKFIDSVKEELDDEQ